MVQKSYCKKRKTVLPSYQLKICGRSVRGGMPRVADVII